MTQHLKYLPDKPLSTSSLYAQSSQKNKALLTFNELIKKPFHKYPTKFSESCFSFKPISLKSTKYSICFCSPKTWDQFLTK